MNKTAKPLFYRQAPFGGVEARYSYEGAVLGKDRDVNKTDLRVRFPWWKFWRRHHVHVSTVFLEIDHAFEGGPPVLWETMLFSAPGYLDQMQWRYTTRFNAVVGHKLIVRCLQKGRVATLEGLPFLDPAQETPDE